MDNRTSLPRADRLVADQVAQTAQTTPQTVAITGRDESITYEELDNRARSLCAALRGCGVGAGDVVSICLPRSIDQIVAQVAAWQCGAAFLPLDPAWPDARLADLVARARCAAILTEPARAAEIAGTVPVVSPIARRRSDAAPTRAPRPDSLAYVIYTSGSTGDPKGVEVTHANLAALVAWHRTSFAVEAGTRTSHLAGLGFDAAVWEVWPTLAAGGTLCLPDDATRADPCRLRDWLVEERIEVAFAPTAVAEPMLALDWPPTTRLRTLLTGADRLTARPAAGLPFALVNNYGPTECTVVATSGVVTPEGDGVPSIGRTIAGTTVRLLDAAGDPVPSGEAGEIWIGGAQVARGYRDDPTLTGDRFVIHPGYGRLYRSGDLARRLPDGELAFLGRLDQQIKVRGHRVEPAEIVAALNRLPELIATMVVQREGELVAYVVPATGTTPTGSGLRAALAETLPSYMLPDRFAAIDALPTTASGKLDAAALPDPTANALPEVVAARAPTTPTERRLFAIIAEVIAREDFGVDDDFFLLGGHSLLGTQVVVRAREAFAVELTLFHLFDDPTVARLAAIVEGLVIQKLAAMSDDDIRRMAAE